MDPLKEFVQTKTLEFSRQRFTAVGCFTRSSLECNFQDTSGMLEHKMYELALQLQCEVLCKEFDSRTHTFIYSHPKTWWDMFKDKHYKLCKWFKRPKQNRVEETVTFNFLACYPEANIIMPEKIGPAYLRIEIDDS